ncbi:hypothetical protein JQ607_02850 [Bradyrhizobium liaoningense]|uniref:hypothetical protein n=1 Tax=Bradyrhizobium liaoningense TaxID=43992 RepID=UPI001BAD8F48|nr:hypothetical protein [Bradyrhizobium liaoningense]MBR0839122.1 hypothetical protein [Bradyrhizobium liaoningense]
MGTLFDDPPPADEKEALQRERQHRADVLAECNVLIREGKDIPYELGRALLKIAAAVDFPNRPLSTVARYERDMVLWRWSEWRWGQLGQGKKRTQVTPQAVASAKEELEYLWRAFGEHDIRLDDTSIKDRITRHLKMPYPNYRWLE